MIRQIRYILMLWLLSSMVFMVVAQEESEVFTFESGVHFTIPPDSVVDASGPIPSINLSNIALIDVVEPSVMGETPDATLNLPLADMMDFLLSAVGFEGTRLEEQTISLNLLDGREALVYEFTNATDNYQLVFVIRLSDGRVGALNIRALESLGQEPITAIGELANSFDSANTATASAVPVVSEAEALLIADLTEAFAYPSGVNFRYSSDYVLIDEDNPPVTIVLEDELIMTLVDPIVIGMPSGETMENIITFAIETTDIPADGFEPLDVGGREAVFAGVPIEDAYEAMVLVRFADERVGIIDITLVDEPTDEQMDMIRSVAASFNSASAETGITSSDIAEARSLFEDAMALRDEGDNEGAIALLTQAIDLNPDLALAHYWRGTAYLEVGQLEDGLAGYNKALELEPTQLQIHEDIGDVYALLDDMDMAVAEYQIYIDAVGEDNVEPNTLETFTAYQEIANGEFNANFYFRRANQLREYGLYDEALESNQVSLDNEPDRADLYAQRGVIYIAMESYPEAVSIFTDGLEVELIPILFYNRGYAHTLNIPNEFNGLINSVHDYQCLLLLADDSITQEQIDFAEQSIDRTIISADSYEPITDPDNCLP